MPLEVVCYPMSREARISEMDMVTICVVTASSTRYQGSR